MKKTLATLLVAGALRSRQVFPLDCRQSPHSGDNSGQGSVSAVYWWPNSTPKY